MDRPIIYTGEIPRSTDVLNGWQQAMIGLGHLAKLVLGSSTWVEGLACVPTNPASMNVSVGPGQIYALDQVDAAGYGSLGANTLEILKQGLVTAATSLACPAPTTAGDSINYLIEASYADIDSDSLVLPYYNSANPSQALSGPSNSGAAQNTIRQGVCQIVVKAGAAAATGSQTTPAPDTGYVGLWVVTVASGATTISASAITAYQGAPFFDGVAGLNLANIFTNGQTINLPAGFVGKLLLGQLNGSDLFYVDQAGNFLTVGDFTADGNLTYKPYVVAPSASQTLPVNQKVICQPSGMTANITLTLPASPAVGAEYLIYGSLNGYQVTVATPGSSVSIIYPDGTEVLSYQILPANSAAGIKLVFDGTNWRAQTFGQPIVAPATAANQAVAKGQVLNVAPVAATTNFNNTSASATSGTLTAPCKGNAVVIASYSSGTGSLTGTNVTASLSGLVQVINSGDGNYFNQSVYYLPMTAGEDSTFTATLNQSTSGVGTVTVVAFFQPTP